MLFVSFLPFCAWRKLKKKKLLLEKAKMKFFFQLNILNYLKNMQLIDLLGYTLLEPSENTIIQFLSKPCISLAHKKDIYDKIHSINDIEAKEIDKLHESIKELYEIKNKTPLQKRLLKMTKMEMTVLMKKIKKVPSANLKNI